MHSQYAERIDSNMLVLVYFTVKYYVHKCSKSSFARIAVYIYCTVMKDTDWVIDKVLHVLNFVY